jgi:hypothetical protein
VDSAPLQLQVLAQARGELGRKADLHRATIRRLMVERHEHSLAVFHRLVLLPHKRAGRAAALESSSTPRGAAGLGGEAIGVIRRQPHPPHAERLGHGRTSIPDPGQRGEKAARVDDFQAGV